EADADQETICSYLPNRTWHSIQQRINVLGDYREFRPKPIRDYETYEQFIKRIEEKGRELYTRVQWSKGELTDLKEILENGGTKLDLVVAFPDRKWTHIRTKITKLFGSDYEVSGEQIVGYDQSL